MKKRGPYAHRTEHGARLHKMQKKKKKKIKRQQFFVIESANVSC